MEISELEGKWDFHFWEEEHQSTLLYLSKKGKGQTSSTAVYLYDFKDDVLHLYIPGIVDYRGVWMGTRFVGEAVCEDRKWSWSASRHVSPVVRRLSEKSLFNSKWVIGNDTEELEDNVLVFKEDGELYSSLYGSGKWYYDHDDLCVSTAHNFILYKIKKVDNEIVGEATNQIGEKWRIFPKISIIPKKVVSSSGPRLKKNYEEYLEVLRENGIHCLYHFTHRENLEKIKASGGLYSWHYLEEHQQTIPFAGGDEVSRTLDKKAKLEDFVRLSFCKHHPMARKLILTEHYDMVLLKISLDPVILSDTKFSDRNATDSQHHHGGSLNHLKRVDFAATQMEYPTDEMERKSKQAEVLVRDFVPWKYVIGIEDF